jgi:hypothetical protein
MRVWRLPRMEMREVRKWNNQCTRSILMITFSFLKKKITNKRSHRETRSIPDQQQAVCVWVCLQKPIIFPPHTQCALTIILPFIIHFFTAIDRRRSIKKKNNVKSLDLFFEIIDCQVKRVRERNHAGMSTRLLGYFISYGLM